MELEENQLQAEALFDIFRSAIRGLEVAGLTRFTLIDEISKGMGLTDLNLAVSTLSEAIKAKESNGGPLPDANKAMVYELLKKLTGGELLAVAKKATAMVNLEDEDSEEYSPRPREIPVVTIEQIKNLQAPRTVHFSGDTKIPEDPDEIKPISAAVTQISPPPTFNKEQPKTAYMLFAEAKRPELQKINPRSTPSELTWHISALWKGMSEQDKKPYVDAARSNQVRCAAEDSKRIGDYIATLEKQKSPNIFDRFKPLSLNDQVHARALPKEPVMMAAPFKLSIMGGMPPAQTSSSQFIGENFLQLMQTEFKKIVQEEVKEISASQSGTVAVIVSWLESACQVVREITPSMSIEVVSQHLKDHFIRISSQALAGNPCSQKALPDIYKWYDQAERTVVARLAGSVWHTHGKVSCCIERCPVLFLTRLRENYDRMLKEQTWGQGDPDNIVTRVSSLVDKAAEKVGYMEGRYGQVYQSFMHHLNAMMALEQPNHPAGPIVSAAINSLFDRAFAATISSSEPEEDESDDDESDSDGEDEEWVPECTPAEASAARAARGEGGKILSYKDYKQSRPEIFEQPGHLVLDPTKCSAIPRCQDWSMGKSCLHGQGQQQPMPSIFPMQSSFFRSSPFQQPPVNVQSTVITNGCKCLMCRQFLATMGYASPVHPGVVEPPPGIAHSHYCSCAKCQLIPARAGEISVTPSMIPNLSALMAQGSPVQVTSAGQALSDQTKHPLSCCCPDCVRAWPKGQEGTVWLTKPNGSSVKTIRLGDDKYQCVACECSTVIPQTTGLMIPILDWKICDECRLQLPNQSQRPHDDEEEDSDDSDSFDKEDEANLQAQLADLKKTMTTADITRAVGPHQTYRHCCPCLYRCHPTDRTMPSALIKECSQNCQCHTATRSIVQEETRARSVVKALYSPLEKNEGCLTAVAGERNCELPGVFSDQGVPLKYLGDGEYESLCCECSYERNPRTGEVERTEKCDLHCGCHQVTVTEEELDAQMDEYQSHGRQCQCPQHYVPADPVTDQDDDRVYFNDYEEEYTEAMEKEKVKARGKPVGLAFEMEGTPAHPIVDGVHVPTKPHQKTGNYRKLCCECLFGYCPTDSGRMFFIQCYDKCCCHQWIKQWGQDKPGRDSEDDSDDEDAIADENSRRFEAYHCAPGRPDCGCRFSGTDFKWMVCQEQCPCHDPDVDCGFQNPHGESF